METTIKAIETHYMGFRFRSRLEARWAVFFNSLGVPFDYEREGFELPSGRYLPDFWLPQQEKWVEIKGALPDKPVFDLCRELHFETGYPVTVFWQEAAFDIQNGYGYWNDCAESHGGLSEDSVRWFHCYGCNGFDISTYAEPHRTVHGHTWEPMGSCHCDPKVHCFWDNHLRDAIEDARSARFEQGGYR